MSEKELIEAEIWLSKYFKIYPKIIDWTIDEILNKAKECVKRYGINTLTIDPFNKVKPDGTKEMRLFVRDLLNKCGTFANEHDVSVCVVAHPAKPSFNEKAPSLYSISESSDWCNMADYGLIATRRLRSNRLGEFAGAFIMFSLSKTILRFEDSLL